MTDKILVMQYLYEGRPVTVIAGKVAGEPKRYEDMGIGEIPTTSIKPPKEPKKPCFLAFCKKEEYKEKLKVYEEAVNLIQKVETKAKEQGFEGRVEVWPSGSYVIRPHCFHESESPGIDTSSRRTRYGLIEVCA